MLAGLGALYAGLASFGGVHEARLKRMVAATTGATIATLVGCLVGPSDVLTVVTVTVAAFAISLLGAAGPDAAQVAVQAVGVLIVLSGVRGANLQPLGNALLVLAGGLGQAGVLALFHPLSPVAAERRAVESVYLALARYARRRDGPLPPAAPGDAARTLLRQGFGYGVKPEREKLWREFELADALRGMIVGLAREGAGEEVWTSLALWLEAAADDVARGRPIERQAPEIGAGPWARRIRRTIEAEETNRFPTVAPMPPTSWLASLRNVESLRALALNHAFRYAVAVGLTTLAYRLMRVDHGYWVPLTVAFSLRPDFATTLVRGVGRIVGTGIGVTLATAFVTYAGLSSSGLTVAMLAAVWISFALQNANYVGFSTGLAFYVVVSVTLSGMAVATAGLERIVATAAGSVFTFAVALSWPRWEAGKVRQTLAVAFAAQAAYADAVEEFDAERATASRHQARSTRLAAERLVAAAGLEPRWSRRRHLEGADAALARLAENAAKILAAHVSALDPHPDDAREDLRRMAEQDRSLAADLMG